MKNLFEFSIRTNRRNDFIDITSSVREAISKSGIREGLCVVHIPHTTAAVTINENADPDVTRDMDMQIAKIAPPNAGYAHSEGNSDSHIKSTLTGCSITIIVTDGKPLLGTWQGVYFCEYDGPRSRRFYIKCIEG
jgi:secondary thiamine-phosphate synthase enzyme